MNRHRSNDSASASFVRPAMYFGYYPGAPKVRMSQKGQRWKYVQSALTSESPALPLYKLSFTPVVFTRSERGRQTTCVSQGFRPAQRGYYRK